MSKQPVLFTLGVDDLEREANFWKEVFGWEPSPRSDRDRAVYDFQGYAVALCPRKTLTEDLGLDFGTGVPDVALSIEVDSENEVEKRLILAVHYGARLVRKAGKNARGDFSGCFTSPSDHLCEVVCEKPRGLERKRK